MVIIKIRRLIESSHHLPCNCAFRKFKFKCKRRWCVSLILIILISVLIWIKLYTCLEGYFINFGPSVSELELKSDFDFGVNLIKNFSGPTTLCSERVTLEGGLHQRVVSFSLFIKNEPGFNVEEVQTQTQTVLKYYVPGIIRNYDLIQKFYPGWVMRIYTNIPNAEQFLGLANWTNENNNSKYFFICDVTKIKIPGLGDLQDLLEMTWRFLPIGDPAVDIFVVRDLDGEITDRERAAVKEWENSGKIFHAMRDSPHHRHHFVLGGLWGAKNYLMKPAAQLQLLDQIITMSREYRNKASCKCNDQHLLRNLLYRPFKTLFLIHDSYSCDRWGDAVPWPTQREKAHNDHVGSKHTYETQKTSVPVCPVQCRPTIGKDWEYC